MKNFRLIIALIVLTSSIDASAQKTSILNGKTYWYMMKNEDGTGEEIHDRILFANNTVYSDRAGNVSKKAPIKVSEKKISKLSCAFKAEILANNGDEYRYDCTVEGKFIVGTVKLKKSDGTVVRMLVRGMLEEEFLRIQKIKEDYRKNNM